ncbi:quinone-dependent dihydroorotate dehydrogenase [bacterium]|nr:quinone-dependent dihydroorotate dehydrogenase [bacterium]
MKPWLLLPPKLAHDLGPWALPLIAALSKKQNYVARDKKWRGLHFRNPLGLAGGVDKTGQSLLSWQKLGVGFLEVGTVTPLPQSANPGKILDRNISQKAVWNKMGFPNDGANALRKKLSQIKNKLEVPLFINIGKNRQTSNGLAANDYINCLENLADFADAFIVNISSPNTKDLRELLKSENLKSFLTPIIQSKNQLSQKKPLLLKLGPDMEKNSLIDALQVSLDLDLDGWILTNTTLSRPPGVDFPSEGGLSGEPLKTLSFENLILATEFLKNKKGDRLLISTGGISTAEDVLRRLNAGADLVQIYSALVFHGPRLFQNILSSL